MASAGLLVLTLHNDLCPCGSELSYSVSCFVFVDKYTVLRGVAGEGETEGERGRESNSKCHLNISPFQVYNDCVNVSLRTQHRTTCVTVCAWLTAMSFFSLTPLTRLSLQSTSLFPPPHHPPICLILSVTHPFSVSAYGVSFCFSCRPVCLLGSF